MITGFSGQTTGKAIVPPFFNYNATTGTIATRGGDGTKDAARAHLQRELRIELEHNKQAAAVKALKEPQEWLDERRIKLEEITDELAGYYTNTLKKYYDAGHPTQEAIDMATQETDSIYQMKLGQLESDFPGGSTFLTGVMEGARHTVTNYKLADGDLEKQAYKRGKAKAKAKYKKRAGAQ